MEIKNKRKAEDELEFCNKKKKIDNKCVSISQLGNNLFKSVKIQIGDWYYEKDDMEWINLWSKSANYKNI